MNYNELLLLKVPLNWINGQELFSLVKSDWICDSNNHSTIVFHSINIKRGAV